VVEIREGDLVLHERHGMGLVSAADGQEYLVDFGGRQEVISRTEPLHVFPCDGWRHLCYCDSARALALVRDEPERVVEMILRDSPDSSVSVDHLRAELAGWVESWDTWWAGAQKAVLRHAAIDSSRAKRGVYRVATAGGSGVGALYQRLIAATRGTRAPLPSGELSKEAWKLTHRIMDLAGKGGGLPGEIRPGMEHFAASLLNRADAPVVQRTEVFLRAMELKWLDDRAATDALSALNAEVIPLYDLSRWAASRIVEPLLGLLGPSASCASLATAFASEPALAMQVHDALLKAQLPGAIQNGILVGLVDNAPDPEKLQKSARTAKSLRAWYGSYAERVRLLGRFLEQLVVESAFPVEWTAIAEGLSTATHRLSKLHLLEPLPEDTTNAVATFWRRCISSAPLSQRSRLVSLASDESIAPPLLLSLCRLYLAMDDSLSHTDMWITLVGRLPENTLLRLLDSLVEEHRAWRSEFDALAHVLGRLSTRGDVQRWVAGRLPDALARDALPLGEVAPPLAHLLEGDLDPRLRDTVVSLLQKATLDFCTALQSGTARTRQDPHLALVSVSGLYAFLQQVQGTAEAQLGQQRDRVTRLQEQLSVAEHRARQAENALEELRRSFRQPEQELLFRGRRAVLAEFAATAADLERYAAASGDRLTHAAVTRLLSLLGGCGVEPVGCIGERVSFDPSRHELIATGAAPGDTVQIIERGFTIRTPQDDVEVLVYVKVSP